MWGCLQRAEVLQCCQTRQEAVGTRASRDERRHAPEVGHGFALIRDSESATPLGLVAENRIAIGAEAKEIAVINPVLHQEFELIVQIRADEETQQTSFDSVIRIAGSNGGP